MDAVEGVKCWVWKRREREKILKKVDEWSNRVATHFPFPYARQNWKERTTFLMCNAFWYTTWGKKHW